jgi:hypothetical protein
MSATNLHMKITNYHIVIGDYERVAFGVYQMCKDGWEPWHGLVSTRPTEYAQAMVKYEDRQCCGGTCHTEDAPKPYTCIGGEQ